MRSWLVGAVVVVVGIAACSDGEMSTSLRCRVSIGNQRKIVAITMTAGAPASVAIGKYTLKFSRAGSGLQVFASGPTLGGRGAEFRSDGMQLSGTGATPDGYLRFACPP